MLPLLGYLVFFIVVASTVIYTWSVSWQSSKGHSLQNIFTLIDEHIHRSFTSLLGYPMLLLAISFILLYRYGGFPPAAWLELYHAWPYLPILLQQGSRPAVILLFVQATCWFIAWVTFGAMTLLTVNHIISSKFFDPKTPTFYHKPPKSPQASTLPPHIYENTNRRGEVHPRPFQGTAMAS
jgi:hypothetical protein